MKSFPPELIYVLIFGVLVWCHHGVSVGRAQLANVTESIDRPISLAVGEIDAGHHPEGPVSGDQRQAVLVGLGPQFVGAIVFGL